MPVSEKTLRRLIEKVANAIIPKSRGDKRRARIIIFIIPSPLDIQLPPSIQKPECITFGLRLFISFEFIFVTVFDNTSRDIAQSLLPANSIFFSNNDKYFMKKERDSGYFF